MRFSVCIPTLNEEKYLPVLLEALCNQTHKEFEVIVADGNSEDNTVAVAESFKPRLDVTVIRTTVRGVSYERNLAAANSSGEHLMFLDADTKPNPDFLERFAHALTHNPVDAATCWNKPLSRNPMDRILWNAYNAVLLSAFARVFPGAIGTCIYFKRATFRALGGFNEQMRYGEDTEIVLRAHKQGYSFAVFKNPPIFFSTRRIERDGRLKYYARGIAWGLHFYLFKKMPKESGVKYEFGKHV